MVSAPGLHHETGYRPSGDIERATRFADTILMAMATEVERWVREPEAISLPVEVIAKRVALMAHEIQKLGDFTLSDISTRPLGIDYAILALPNDFHATLTPKGEEQVAAAYRFCRDKLRPYLIEDSTSSIDWDNLFYPLTAKEWLETVAWLWKEELDCSHGNLEYSPAGAAVDFFVREGIAEDPSSMRLQVVFDRESGSWVLAIFDPTRSQRKWLRDRGWDDSGNAMFVSYSTLDGLVAATINAVDALCRPAADGYVEITLSGISEENRHPEEWEEIENSDALFYIRFPGEGIANFWPGSDLEFISERISSDQIEDVISAFDIFGKLRAPLEVELDVSHLRSLRASGFSVVESNYSETGEIDDEEETVLAIVYPKATRVLAV